MSMRIAAEVNNALLNAPLEYIRLEPGMGGFRIIGHDGKVITTGGDLAFGKECVREHNEQVDKNRMTGAVHL